ncbi:unnamed protein product [Camellia sinensis]
MEVRQLFHLSDGGTMALDWLMNSNGCKPTNISCQKGSQIDTLKPHNGKPQLHFIALFTNQSEPLFTFVTVDCLRLHDSSFVTNFLGEQIQELNLFKGSCLSHEVLASIRRTCPNLRVLVLELAGGDSPEMFKRNLTHMLNSCSCLEALCIKIRGTELDANGFQSMELSLPKTVKVLKLQPLLIQDAIHFIRELRDDKIFLQNSTRLSIPVCPGSPGFALQSLSLVLDIISDELVISITKSLPFLVELDLEDRPIEQPQLPYDLTNISKASFQVTDAITKDDRTPIVIVIPGLTSDSASASDCFYNAGWTEDIRKVIDHLHCKYPEAPLFVVGTSIGANILVKYLGICDRFINRRMAQKFYDKALTIGLKGYAQHQTVISRLADWEGIEKSRSVRDFDNYATRVLGKYETVDTYYRHNSSTNFVGNVMVPLLCISTLDDPVCTREAIPWDECRANKNIVLATTHHGGHLAFYEGIAAKSLWWVRAVHEFFSILHSSSLIHRKKEAEMQIPPQESSIDQGPYVNITEDGMVTALGNEQTSVEDVHDEPTIQSEKVKDATPKRTCLADAPPQPPGQDINDVVIPVRRYMDQLSRHSRKSIWLLAYIAIITTWPLVGSALTLFLRKKFANLLPAVLRRR